MNRNVLGYVAIFSLLSMISLTVAVLFWGVNNDYMIYEVNEFTKSMGEAGLVSDAIVDSADASAEEYAGLINYFDWYWLLSYIIFIGSTVSISYFVKDEDEFSFLTMLFYGTMVLLFLFFIMNVLTDWFSSEVLYKIMPNLSGTLPKFDSWINNAGIFTLIHLIICMLANKVNLNLNVNRKKGVEFVDNDEVL
jgi:hypothetical protein